jgi:hypothetical protein
MVQGGNYIECCDWIPVGSSEGGFQVMIPLTYYVDVFDEFILILN